MAKVYNGRFNMPVKTPGGALFNILASLAILPGWPIFGPYSLIASAVLFVVGGKLSRQRKLYDSFMKYCTVIGMSESISIRELSKAGGMGIKDTRHFIQQMIAKGYFGSEAQFDVSADMLLLPKPAPVVTPQPAPEARSWSAPEPVQRSAAASEAQARPEASSVQYTVKAQAVHVDGASKSYMDELELTLGELVRLNARIKSVEVSQRIDRIGELTTGIFRCVIDKPERDQEVHKFMNYYLPTTLKLLKSYELLEAQSYQSENIIASRKKIENVLDMLVSAYEHLLNGLFSDAALDIATDVDVLETMVAADGLLDRPIGLHL